MPSKGESSVAVNSGLYQLVIALRKARVIKVGRSGRFSFPKGYYVYTGSAKRGLESRIARHLRRKKKVRWHVDYLLRYGRVVEVRRYSGATAECKLNRRVEGLPDSVVVAPRFGSSDCKCSTHLFYFERNPARELG